MDVLSPAASVITVIELTASLMKLCGGYIQEVRNAREEILALQRAIAGLHDTLQSLKNNLQKDKGKGLSSSSQLPSNIAACLSYLQELEARLDPGKGKKPMRRMGLRALKWPLKRTEVQGLIQSLERYKLSFLLALQVDLRFMITGIDENTDSIDQHLNLGKLEGAMEAGFESFADRNEVDCLPGTRAKLLQEITEWALSQSSKSIFWLHGKAGTGKSTISRTVARLAKDRGHLGASFFFKRGEEDRGNAKKFFQTLTRQLILWKPELRPGVQKALKNDPDIASKSLREQFEKLLLHPLLGLDQGDQPSQNTVMVIDALDECEDDRDVQNIIRLLPRLQEVKSLRLRIFLTSRTERPISLGFSKIGNHVYQDLALHEIPEEVTEHDIHLFLQNRFRKIRDDRNIPKDWPGDDIIQELVKISVPLFISAATVCRYIENPKWEPKFRLAELLKDQAKYASQMDKMYLPILTRLLDDKESDESEQQQLLQEFQDIVGVIILLAAPLSINALSPFLEIEVDRIINRLDSFRSVLTIPSDENQPVRIFHRSFSDFLIKSSTKYHVDERQKHRAIARCCLRILRRRLKRNICNLENPGMFRADIDRQHISQCLPPELEYSCRYWIHHFEKSQDLTTEKEELLLFLRVHFLHWLEAMSLLGRISEVVDLLDHLRTLKLVDELPLLSEFLHDGARFALRNCQIADQAPLQIYYAGLVFAPRRVRSYTDFKLHLPSCIRQLPRVHKNWGAGVQTLEGHSGPVNSVTFSHDGRLLASGSSDRTVKIWDTKTGRLMQTFEGSSGLFQSVTFSHDDQLLAYGCDDNAVRIRSLATGELEKTLDGHLGTVELVAFSPDGRWIASADKDVILWNTATGNREKILENHTGCIRSLTFLSDGKGLVSVSADGTVRCWNPDSGDLEEMLEGNHSFAVDQVAISRDGLLLAASIIGDDMVWVWDLVQRKQRELDGHPNSVHSVAFSHDSRLLLSGSIDGKLWVWDLESGALLHMLPGHSDTVNAVTFSPDGQLLASASEDMTVRIWDSFEGATQHTDIAQLDAVDYLSFSPNGQLLASASIGGTVRIWDTATGALQETHRVGGFIVHIDFARKGLRVNTTFNRRPHFIKLGTSGVRYPHGNRASQLTSKNLEVSIECGQWIKMKGERILRLPPEFRPNCSEIRGNLVALGLASGMVSIIGFRD